MAEPRDIALSIRLKPRPIPSETGNDNLGGRNTGRRDEVDGLEDLFDEVGLEYLDEASLPEDDDERRESCQILSSSPSPSLDPNLPLSSSSYDLDLPRVLTKEAISIEERIRQTLMTHMWSNMVRKPLSTPSRGLDLDWDDGDEVLGGNGEIASAEFPVSFDPSSNNSQATTGEAGETNDFPGLDELKSQIMLEDLEQRNNPSGSGDRLGFSRLDMMDDENDDFDFDDMGRGGGDGGDWVEAEYAKLDDWLEEDGGKGAGGNHGEGTNTLEHDDHDMHESDEDENNEIQLESQFEDDFADFAPFQSAPPPPPLATGSGSTSASASLDPTPLLLHLQNVREELAGMDEDTRRVRAGREVESVLKSLGLGGLDWEDDELDEMDPRVGETRRNEIG